MKTVLVSKAGAALTILLSFLAVYSLASALASLQTLIYAAAGLLLFALPGLVLGLALFGRESYRCPEWAIFGSLLGIGLSGYTAVAVGYLIRWSPGLIVLAILILTGVCALIAAEFWSHPLLPIPRRWEYWEYVLLGAIVAALTAFVAVPLLNVGTFTAHGYAYTWLFGYDFLVRGEYVTAMTAGFPPQCMPLAGKPLNMYLVSYALPAFTYSASHKTISLHAILQLNTLAVSILFYASLLSFLRLLLTKAKVLIPTIFVCTFGYSYYWIVGLVKYVLLRPGQPEEFHKIGQQLVTYGYVSHLFTPLVLVELPALLALSLLLLLLFASELTKYEMQRYGLALCFGLILGIIFGIDGSLSMGLMLWFGIVYLVKLLMNRNHRVERFWLLFTAVLSCGGICLSFFLLGMYQWKSAHEIQFSVYSWLFKFALLYFPLEFGPLILLGVWGFILQWRRNRSTTPIALLILAAIALLQSAFIEMSVLPRIRMAVRILPFVLLVGVGYFFRYLWEYSDRRRKLCIAWGLVLLAVPTFFTDIYFASDVKNVNETHYVRIEDREACRWIHRSLPDVAVVQGEPKYLGNVDGYNGRHELFVSLIADFAERPQALGWPYIASELVPNGIDIVFHRMKDLEVMLSSTQTETILAVARKYGIQYIYVGPYEQSLHPALLSTLVAASQQFEQVYSAQGVHIFGVVEGSRPELAKLP